MYLISVYFDDNANKTLQKYIDKIAAVTGSSFMTDNNVPPHMTISSIEARSVGVIEPAFENLRGSLSSGKIFIASPGQLLPYVMFVSPVLNEYLLDFSKTIYNAVKDIPE
nr:hypothetical protein [Eubacterium sp.]